LVAVCENTEAGAKINKNIPNNLKKLISIKSLCAFLKVKNEI